MKIDSLSVTLRLCPACNQELTGNRNYCSPACKQKAYRSRASEPNQGLEQLVNHAIDKCKAQGADPKDLLIAFKLRELKEFLLNFEGPRRRSFVARLIEWEFDDK